MENIFLVLLSIEMLIFIIALRLPAASVGAIGCIIWILSIFATLLFANECANHPDYSLIQITELLIDKFRR